MRMKRIVVTAMLAGCAAALIFGGTPGVAAEPSSNENGRAVKVPETADDHLALAKGYDDKATTWRNEAAYHREMAAAYKKTRGELKGVPNAWDVKMEKHCMTIVKDAEKLAADAEESAKYHRLRAKELQGK